MIRVGIVGATGYGSRELLRLLAMHPGAEVASVTSESAAGRPIREVLPALRGLYDIECEVFDSDLVADRCDVVFVGVPSAKSMPFVVPLRERGVRVVDIGPDFRLSDPAVFEQYYGEKHAAPQLLDEAVYGLVPINRAAIEKTNLVAVPGCYPISAILPLLPILQEAQPEIPVVVDSVSGITGAGRTPNDTYHFPEMNENVRAYSVSTHRHTPEIEQALGGKTLVQFSPHVAPYSRGILSTITVRPTKDFDVAACYAAYADEPFIRILGENRLPEVKYVRDSNFCDIGWVKDDRTGNLVIISAIDNLIGGTAGMAIQSMNLMFGLDERTALSRPGMAP
jgi:N-acetyl-gamma-glutamyl-phosphate reductase